MNVTMARIIFGVFNLYQNK